MASRISGCTPALLSLEKPRAGLIEVFSIAQQCSRVQSGMTLEPWPRRGRSDVVASTGEFYYSSQRTCSYVGFHVQETSQLYSSEPSAGGDGGQRSNASVL